MKQPWCFLLIVARNLISGGLSLQRFLSCKFSVSVENELDFLINIKKQTARNYLLSVARLFFCGFFLIIRPNKNEARRYKLSNKWVATRVSRTQDYILHGGNWYNCPMMMSRLDWFWNDSVSLRAISFSLFPAQSNFIKRLLIFYRVLRPCLLLNLQRFTQLL